MKEELRIPRDRPLAGFRLIQALNSGPKLAIIKILLKYKEGLPAKEISRMLGVKLPTTLEHLSDLIKTGLVHVEFNGRRKNYVLTSRKIVLEIDLEQLVMLDEKRKDAELKELEALAYRYLEEKTKKDKLPMTITVKDVVNTLGIDTNTAIEIVDFINTFTDKFVLLIERKILDILRSEDGLTIDDLAKKLNMHKYWVIIGVQSLKSKSLVKIVNNKVYG